MSTASKVLGNVVKFVIAGILVVGASLYFLAHGERFSYRQRITIEIDTPDGPRTGSGVSQVDKSEATWGLPEARGVHSQVRGEAIFVDLGRGKNVIATLAFQPDARVSIDRLALVAFLRDNPKLQWKEVKTLTGRIRLDGELVPLLVTFGDLSDPKTARLVDPNGFGEVFGPGYAFKRATLEMVSAGSWPLNLTGLSGTPITRGIEQNFQWWGQRQPWMKELSPGVFVDTRTDAFKVTNELFKRDF